MRQDGNYYIWNKGEKEALSANLSTSEFSCQCKYSDCIEQKADVELINKLQLIRDWIKLPLKITSGYRCSKHQKDLGESGIQTAKGLSQHELGKAADIKCSSLTSGELAQKAENFFQAIGIANSFVHVDLRGPEKRRWSYTQKA